MAYSIRHITRFGYDPPVRESVMEVRMQPRTDARQRCMTFSLGVLPQANVMVYRDFFGNMVHHFDIPGRTNAIEVDAQAIVDVTPPVDSAPDTSWNDLDAQVAKGDYWEMLLPSHFARPTDLLEKLATELRVERRDTPYELLLELNAAIYKAFEYVPESTEVHSPIDHSLESRQGVCQDFAHIMITLLRRLRIPARYVSGYLFHQDANKDRSPAGATHAWVEAYLGECGWTAFDPTNNLLASERHIRVALGRDYSDVPPTRGVFKGEPERELSVLVTVNTVDTPEPEELPPATVIRMKQFGPADQAEFDQQQQQQQQQQQ
jgi:transglutaminase-like putative cysteine protease